jgi:riboflavin kinase/FMN adenylyltransferase
MAASEGVFPGLILDDMQLFSSLDSTKADGVWLTIGSFDGVHRGHQEIIRRLVAGAHAHAVPAVVLTFYPHPAVVLRGSNGPFYLSTPEERAEIIGGQGADIVIIQCFDRQLANTSARDFVMKLRERLGLRHLLVGHDFTLGRGREGDVPTLRRLGEELGFEVETNQPVLLDGQVISSSQIRSALTAANVEYAHQLLGRPYRLTAKVVPGDGRGRTIGIPTANLEIWSEQLLPAAGVYACQARIGETVFRAATNIGIRPTFDSSTALLHVEAHLLDFQGDLYGQKIQLEFLACLRGEQKFADVQALVAQIQEDIVRTRQLVTQESPS